MTIENVSIIQSLNIEWGKIWTICDCSSSNRKQGVKFDRYNVNGYSKLTCYWYAYKYTYHIIVIIITHKQSTVNGMWNEAELTTLCLFWSAIVNPFRIGIKYHTLVAGPHKPIVDSCSKMSFFFYSEEFIWKVRFRPKPK